MDVRFPLMVVGTADSPSGVAGGPDVQRLVYTFNLQNPGQPHSTIPSPLKHQTRCIATFPDCTGYAVGSIEGRVAIHHVDDSNKSRNFAFKCHRQPLQNQGRNATNEVYAVNSISFHPQGTFATAGSDGVFNFWDKDSKQRLKNFTRVTAPISTATFSPDGSLYGYAVSYDWSKGREYQAHYPTNDIFLHVVELSEVQPRPHTKNNGRR